jgi:chaperonin cofactor prefoldin
MAAKEMTIKEYDAIFSKLWCSMMLFDKAMEYLYDADDMLHELGRMRFKLKHERGKLQKVLNDYVEFLNHDIRTLDDKQETKDLRLKLLTDYDKFGRKIDEFFNKCIENGEIKEY